MYSKIRRDSSMKLEYAGVSKENLKSGLNLSTMSAITRNKFIKTIFSKKSSDMLDWLDLPNQNPDDVKVFWEYGKYVRRKFDNFVVLGIGGSALGIKMLQNTFVDSLNKDIGIKVYVCDNIDPDSFVTLIDKLNLKKTMFNVITKSGGTSETLAQMSIIIERYKSKKIDYSKHFCVTTTKDNDLYNYAKLKNMQVFDIPKGVGGRFSVLSSVGLVPASVMGIDIFKLLLGASIAKNNSQDVTLNNIAYSCAYINYSYLNKGLTNLVTMPYSDRLALVPDFFAQLWAESLGKKLNRQGEVVYAGQTPIKTLGVTDQHSQLQLYSEGIKDKIIMFMTVENSDRDEKINSDLLFAPHLKNTTLKTLLDYEYNSTSYSLTTLDRPNYTISIERVDEENMGKLIFFMEMMTAFMGEFLNINTYDQPGVELSKIYTKACLHVKGYETQAKEIKNYSLDKKTIVM